MEDEVDTESSQPTQIRAKAVRVPRGAHLLATWGPYNELSLFASVLPSKRQSAKCAPKDLQTVCTFNWDTRSPPFKKLLNESHGRFMLLQRASVEFQNLDSDENLAESGAAKAVLIESSAHYRRMLDACLADLMKQEATSSSSDEKDQLDLIGILSTVWHLCEIFFIQQPSIVTLQLMEWLQTHYAGPDRFNELISQEQPELDADYWTAMYKLVLQGRAADAIELLSRHSQAQLIDDDTIAGNVFTAVQDVLASMPHYLLTDSISEFTDNFHEWRAHVKELQNDSRVRAESELITLVNILTGDTSIIRALSDSWLDHLVAELLFVNPTLKSFEIQYKLSSIVSDHEGTTPLRQLDHILLAIMDFDVHKTLALCSHLADSWFLCHLTDLLFHSGHIDAYKLDTGMDIREHFMFAYASSLVSINMWEVAVVYLSNCPVSGRSGLGELVTRQPLDSDRKALQLLHICGQHQLHEEGKLICNVMGSKYLRKKRYAQAIFWLLRGQSSSRVGEISEKLLEEFLQHGSTEDIDSVVDGVGTDVVLSGKLTFLTHYRQLKQIQQELAEFSTKQLTTELQAQMDDLSVVAGQLLVQLIARGIAPKRFWGTLLFQSVPLLEGATVVLGFEDTTLLMQSLQTITTSYRKDEYLLDVDQDQIDVIRLALVRNLSRAVVAKYAVVPS
eukprot:GILK01007857.1.p1 GENE.GILK01007857.1~~GILK01007857.1.p1  ORF type:complete len:688 (-),score=125.40 GILK01007857.1:886-2910(-)